MVSNSNPTEPAPVIDGIVLAAGRSRRMGRPKALLPVDDAVFLERTVEALRDGGCRGIIVVVGAGADEVVRQAEQLGAKVVVNPDPDSQQIASLRLGLDAIGDEAVAAVVLPVDHPLVSAGTVLRLIAAFRASGAAIVRPTYHGVPGHPGIFARRIFGELFREDLAHGAHDVVEAHAADRLDVPVRDPGTTANVDTPDDYRRFVEGVC